VEKSIETAAEVIEALRENSLYEMIPEFSKVASILAVIPMLSGALVQRTRVLKDLSPEHTESKQTE